MDSKALWLTPNTVSIYIMMWLELSDEPMVIETHPNVLGIIDDHWFNYVADFGKAGSEAPAGKESNWSQTVQGKGWNMLFRL